MHRLFRAALVGFVLSSGAAAHALIVKPYSAAELAAAQSAGAPVAVHFHADWCPTCKAQTKAFDSLKSDPQLGKVTLLVANYDAEKELRRELKIRAQSTIVVFKGKTEVSRNGGDTDPAALKASLAKAL